jgi:hypothetical protein
MRSILPRNFLAPFIFGIVGLESHYLFVLQTLSDVFSTAILLNFLLWARLDNWEHQQYLKATSSTTVGGNVAAASAACAGLGSRSKGGMMVGRLGRCGGDVDLLEALT